MAYLCRSKNPRIGRRAHWHHLRNKIHRSLSGGDAALSDYFIYTVFVRLGVLLSGRRRRSGGSTRERDSTSRVSRNVAEISPARHGNDHH